MKRLFFFCGLGLLTAWLALRSTAPDAQSETPIIYWVIDPAPARGEQIELFHRWQIRNGHGQEIALTNPDDVRAFRARAWSPAIRAAMEADNPAVAELWNAMPQPAAFPVVVRVPTVEARLDAANNDLDKKLIQGISGVAGDVIEAYNAGVHMNYLAGAGILADVTEAAARLGFGPEKTYPALAPSLFFRGRQYAYPRNVATTQYWVNLDTFERHGQPPPPTRWTIEAFETRGRAFVAAANVPGARRRVFFADRACLTELRRSTGLSMFNETLTRCALDDPRNARVLERIHQWTYRDRLLPSAADRAGFDTEGGWGGQSFQLFNNGRYAMFASGRWALMLFRQFGALRLAVAEPPHGGFPNVVLAGGQSTVFRGSPRRSQAELFLAFMASEEYNMQIVRSGDALPPNPAYTDTEQFRRPPDFPNEWGVHEPWSKAARDIGITHSLSPFVHAVVSARYDNMALDEVMNERATAAEAAVRCAERINEEIARSLRESRFLQEEYARRVRIQDDIERRREAGRPIPAAWLYNPFHQAYYRDMGWLESAKPDRERKGAAL